jgi:hypothetical protein
MKNVSMENDEQLIKQRHGGSQFNRPFVESF